MDWRLAQRQNWREEQERAYREKQHVLPVPQRRPERGRRGPWERNSDRVDRQKRPQDEAFAMHERRRRREEWRDFHPEENVADDYYYQHHTGGQQYGRPYREEGYYSRDGESSERRHEYRR